VIVKVLAGLISGFTRLVAKLHTTLTRTGSLCPFVSLRCFSVARDMRLHDEIVCAACVMSSGTERPLYERLLVLVGPALLPSTLGFAHTGVHLEKSVAIEHGAP
jgi:hypothetical protein